MYLQFWTKKWSTQTFIIAVVVTFKCLHNEPEHNLKKILWLEAPLS